MASHRQKRYYHEMSSKPKCRSVFERDKNGGLVPPGWVIGPPPTCYRVEIKRFGFLPPYVYALVQTVTLLSFPFLNAQGLFAFILSKLQLKKPTGMIMILHKESQYLSVQDHDIGHSKTDDAADDDCPQEVVPGRRSGRRKIKIEYIDDKSRRQITFSKRKAGIMKKVRRFDFILKLIDHAS